MKEMKRIVALVLCLVMLVGYLPIGAQADEVAPVQEPSAITDVVVEEAAVEAEENDEESLTPDTGDPAPADEEVVSEENTTSEEETPAEDNTAGEETPAAEEATEEAAAFVLEEVTFVAPMTNADNLIDAAIFCSDVHGSTSDLTNVMGGVAKSGVDYSAIGFVGDTCLTVENTTSIVQSALGDTDIAVMFSYASSHDTEDGADINKNWDYSGEVEGVSENYLVYTIRETDMQNASDANTAAPAFTAWYNGLTAAEKALPIFIMSHRPLHARRNDNAGAATWYSAISAAAESSDIVFFWAHNHTSESSVDTAAYYVAKDGTESFTVYNGDTVVPNFTYMNAGYINANNQNPARLGVATTVQITADSLVFQDYNSSGAFTGDYSHNLTVAREFAGSTDSGAGDGGSTGETTPPTTETKEVYVLVDTMTVGEDYLIANGNSGSVTLLGQSSGSATTTTAEVKTSGDYAYIESADAGYVWNATAHTNSSYSSYPRLINAESYAMYVSNKALAFGSGLADTEGAIYTRYWTYTSGQLACVSTNSNSTTYYLTYSDSAFSMTSTATDGIYIYEKQTITVSSDGTVSGGGSDDSSDDNTGSGDSGNTGDSTETVVGEATVNTATDNSWQTVTFGTEGEKKTLYVLVDSITSGEEYLIVNTNSTGTGYGLGNSTSGDHAVTITSGNLTVNGTSGTHTYIEDKGDALEWTATGSDSSVTFASGDYKLGTSGSGGNRKLTVSSSSSWVFTGSALYYDGQNDYYVAYSSGSWGISSSNTSSRHAYLYQRVDIDTSSSVTYSVTASDITHVYTESTTDTETVTIGASTNKDSNAVFTYEILSDEKDIISGDIAADGTVTLTGAEGTAQVKISYTWTEGENTYTIWKVVNITASNPYYTLDLHKQNNGEVGDEITAPIAIKGIEAGDTYSVWAVIKKYDSENPNGADIGTLEDSSQIEWSSSDTTIATVDPATGIITFTGKEGSVNITATYLNGNRPSDTITISATASLYNVPADGTTDFPEYPHEGAIRYDKTATAVGNFSETGIAQVELSMTGVPYTSGSEIDVVLMLDITGSMHDVTSSSYTYSKYTRVEATIIAAMEFVKSIVVNEDGSYNKNRVGIYSFNSGGTYTLWELGAVTDLDTINAAIQKFNDNYKSGGTPYDDGLSKVQSVLTAAKTDGTGNKRQQFAVFMTDGVPTDYEYVNGTSHANYSDASTIAGMLTSSDNYQTRDDDYKYEYYSTEMKKDGVTVYSVGIGLENTNSAWSGSATQCLNLASRLLNDISGPAGETTQPDAVGTSTLSKQDSYFFSVEDSTAATDMKNVFKNIAQKILQAATDVTVEDKIADDYTMIFSIPTDTNYEGHDISTSQEFYIEFLKYALNPVYEQVNITAFTSGVKYFTKSGDTYTQASTYVAGTTYYVIADYTRSDSTSISKLYLIDSNGSTAGGTYSAGSSATAAYAAPVFENKTIGEKGTLYYWTTDSSYASKAAASCPSGGTTYYFIPYGIKATDEGYDATKWFNMTSGAYAFGNIDPVTNTSSDLVIATPYFVYNAATRKLFWTVDKLDNEEYALKYFLYLDDSATDIGEETETDSGPYPTNDYAYITYTNFNGNECRQEFPVPQMNWNGAQVSYVFYLVNAAGQPINKSGQVVDFANAVFVTDVYTKSVVWNKQGDTTTGVGDLSADWLADELLPDDYTVYDPEAGYVLNVWENADGDTIKNEFTIEGGTADVISAHLNEKLTNVETTNKTVSLTTTKVYNTKGGTKITGYGTYYSDTTTSIDFASTTVAFAVVWQPALVPDVVVVDYGLDVLINVVQNDLMQNTVSGIGLGTEAYETTAMNTGVSSDSKLGTADLTTDVGHTISIANENQIRFHQNDMEFNKSTTFYYESPVKFYEESEQKTGYMYSSVTVIPATTIYYEDEFVELKTYTLKEGSTSEYNVTEGWDTNSVKATATQAQDRPGESLISDDLDADNIYGYDSAYKSMSKHSLGSAAKVHVDADSYATASFSFYGTGFDVISMTSNTTGVLAVKVVNESGTKEASNMVNTYYGYTTENHEIVYTYTNGAWVSEDKGLVTDETVVTAKPENPAEGSTYTATEQVWVVTPDTENALYQVPVLQIEGLNYGLHTVTITATYAESLDKTSADGYDLYLDAIRIYDPANDGAADETVKNAYVKDGEGWPSYIELRNKLIGKETFGNNDETAKISGVVFIDGDNSVADGQISDYTSYGPNNEVYLAKDQSIAFILEKPNAAIVKNIHLGVKSANGVTVTYTIKNVARAAINNVAAGASYGEKTFTVNTSTDMYYDITSWSDDIIVITNTSSNSAILSLTNIKATYTENPNGVSLASSEEVPVVKAAAEETGSEVGVYMTPDAAKLTLLSMKQTEEEPEESVPETSEPVETEPEDPSTETTEPEETEPENTTKPTEPEETKPGNQRPSQNSAIKYLTNVLKKLLGGWFR